MKKNLPIKILLDSAMVLLFIALMDIQRTGLAFHEIAGIA